MDGYGKSVTRFACVKSPIKDELTHIIGARSQLISQHQTLGLRYKEKPPVTASDRP